MLTISERTILNNIFTKTDSHTMKFAQHDFSPEFEMRVVGGPTRSRFSEILRPSQLFGT